MKNDKYGYTRANGFINKIINQFILGVNQFDLEVLAGLRALPIAVFQDLPNQSGAQGILVAAHQGANLSLHFADARRKGDPIT